MFEYIEGKIAEINPSFVVIDINGLGYFINISLQTYALIEDKNTCKLFIYQVIREDSNSLYGFYSKKQRELFVMLISVSGIGANTARTILSSLSYNEIKEAIQLGNVNVLKSVKGIGIKTAQRVIIDLRDKIEKHDNNDDVLKIESNTIKEESLSALVMLGFSKKDAEKSIDRILKKSNNITVEELVKQALRSM